MPIIAKGGRKNIKIRGILLAMYLILIVGSITMLYPFMLMISSSLTSSFDFDDLVLVPKYLYDNEALMKKYVCDKYGQGQSKDLILSYNMEGKWNNWNDIREDSNFMGKVAANTGNWTPQNRGYLKNINNDWLEFRKTIPVGEIRLYYDQDDNYREFLKEKYLKLAKKKYGAKFDNMPVSEQEKKALAVLNQKHGRAYNKFLEILPMKSFLYLQKWFPYQRADFNDWLDYKKHCSPDLYDVFATKRLWVAYLSKRFLNVQEMKKETGLKFDNFSSVPFPVPVANKKLYPAWQEFLQKKYPVRLVSFDKPAKFNASWRKYLKVLYQNNIKRYNQHASSNLKSFSQVKFPAKAPDNKVQRVNWIDFILEKVPVKEWNLNMPETRYVDFLKKKYGTIASLNKAYGSDYKSFAGIKIPYQKIDYYEVMTNPGSTRANFSFRNYVRVAEFLVTKGRALWVTIVLIALTIFSALTVNPLAAYALSRGNQATAAKVLILFLATMAFPAEVAMIPGFLLIKNLGLLNTFAALILPGLANGYSIFLLKGFFDSIPRELYEAAHLDGATEFQSFRMITFPMSKPIMAVIALNAFKMAYGGFMWAFLTCQDPKMWTIMVWLYDFQSRYATKPGLVMTALVFASIPTLLVFLFCQKIIMRGIIIPSMK